MKRSRTQFSNWGGEIFAQRCNEVGGEARAIGSLNRREKLMEIFDGEFPSAARGFDFDEEASGADQIG